MRPHIPATLALLATLSTVASADPFPQADIAAGQKLHAENCVSCHARNFGGEDAAAIYTRADRRVTSAAALSRQISFCTTQLQLQLFPEDELNLAGYLNQRYYKFK
ncbi:hypothetical protein CJ010_09340 [Azoarcus sp. DD4]|uniref:c-type cytochrome n=1 Tax=Azoarcus sp. DD4 TaxID=2027405 RepID=UPI00112C2CEB|nr:cytochrome c [Azoarcus sp. DD4]QDF96716.1 hypothetical protein CJ010_09340 [Azoarcus sp. DD4]